MPPKWQQWRSSLSSEFFRNVFTLSSGTAIGSGLLMAGTVVLMKIYDPGDFGLAAWFISVYAIVAAVITGKYEWAIVLPGEDRDAQGLFWVTVWFSTLFSVLCFLVMLVFYDPILRVFGVEKLGWTIYLIPLSAFLLAVYQALFYYANRTKRYSTMAVSKITTNITQIASQLAFGLTGINFKGLILGRVIGQIGGIITFSAQMKKVLNREIAFSKEALTAQAKKYIEFPKHLVFSNGISLFYQEIPVFFIAFYFTQEMVGHFSVAMQFIAVPNVLIANAIGDVFRQRAAEDFNKTGRFDYIFKKTLKTMFIAGLLPFILVYFAAPYVFEWYDEKWAFAGEMASILAIGIYFSFVITPIDKTAIIRGKTKFILLWHISFCLSHLLAAAVTYQFGLSVLSYLYLVVLVRIVHYFIELYYSYRFAKGL